MIKQYLEVGLLFLLTLLAPATCSASAYVGPGQTTPLINTEERERGQKLYLQHEFVEASVVLRKAVKENKADDEAWYYLGLSLLPQRKKIKDAAKAFETAIKLRPKFAAAHAGLAFAFLLRNKSGEAMREARAALSLDPNMADAYYVLGVAWLRAGERNEALENAEAAIKLNPSLAGAYLLKSQALVSFLLGDALIQEGEVRLLGPSTARYDGAAEALEKYLELHPSAENKETWTEQLESLRFYGSARGKTKVGERPFRAKEVKTKARVLRKPEPAYTKEARDNLITGTVVLSAVFSSDGTVKHLLILNGLPNGLTETAVRAARQIKFTPATIDGRAVSQFVRLEYNFNLY